MILLPAFKVWFCLSLLHRINTFYRLIEPRSGLERFRRRVKRKSKNEGKLLSEPTLSERARANRERAVGGRGGVFQIRLILSCWPVLCPRAISVLSLPGCGWGLNGLLVERFRVGFKSRWAFLGATV